MPGGIEADALQANTKKRKLFDEIDKMYSHFFHVKKSVNTNYSEERVATFAKKPLALPTPNILTNSGVGDFTYQCFNFTP